MDECCRNQHAGAEMSREEEELVGDGYRGKAFDDDGEGACCRLSDERIMTTGNTGLTRSTQNEYKEQSKNMETCIVVFPVAFASAYWSDLSDLSSMELSLEYVRG